ncbi:hypothetical protein [Armatimonas sp.]|uniref:hypothetical protein n=1 Tax=Armatimonas sp. TaxID=1872638 RepID=UPI00286BFC88|nr:hypothetical protein [Armatimonas sp.]
MNRRSLLVSSLTALAFPLEAFARPQQIKSLAIVPRSGPLADTTVYTNSYAVLVGISAYAHLGKNLSFAAKDATDLRDVLVASYGFLPENIAVLTDTQAT